MGNDVLELVSQNHSVKCYITTYVCVCPKITPVSAVGSQNVTNKSFLVCVKGEKYAFWVTLRTLGSMRQCEAEIFALQYFVRQSQSAFIKTHFSVSWPPQGNEKQVFPSVYEKLIFNKGPVIVYETFHHIPVEVWKLVRNTLRSYTL